MHAYTFDILKLDFSQQVMIHCPESTEEAMTRFPELIHSRYDGSFKFD